MKPFRGWDGEGVTVNGEHKFILLAGGTDILHNATDLDTLGKDVPRLTTKQCSEFLLEPRSPAFDIWYSFGYDIAQILKDLPLHGYHSLELLWNKNHVWANHFFYKYIPRKFFEVRRRKNENFRSTDAFSFFQCSFVKALRDWGLDPSKIEEGKASRRDFSEWKMRDIIAYNDEEMQLLMELMERLRAALIKPELIPTSWHGPGALANKWYTKNKSIQHYGVWEPDVDIAARHAYFGGRIDCSLVGMEETYHYDIESAYPASLANCPSLQNLRVRYTTSGLPPLFDFALYHITWDVPRDTIWTPFPWRAKHGTILWPTKGEGWYWGCEIKAALLYWYHNITFLEAYIFETDDCYPFREPITKDFKWRKDLKDAKDASHIALKLGLNSLYGKLCQHVGFKKGVRPKWQNILWAGFITASTRAKLYCVLSLMKQSDLIAVCTDGIFSKVPLEEAQGGLGNFTLEHDKSKCLFIAPGIYSVHQGKDVSITKQRGIPSDINFGHILRSWGCKTKLDTPGNDSNSSPYTRFVGIGTALHTDDRLGDFIEDERKIANVSIRGTSKRFPEHPIPEKWRTLPLYVRERPEPVISYPYIPKEARDYLDE